MSDKNKTYAELPWAVWGSSRKPIFEGTETEVKQFVEEQFPRQDLAVASPAGAEYVYEGGQWVEV